MRLACARRITRRKMRCTLRRLINTSSKKPVSKHLPRYRVGSFLVSTGEGLLLREGGAPVSLTPKAFDMLVVLVEGRGRVIGKEELMQRVWADSFVAENNLAQNISLLRKTLGAGYVETIPKRGYRFTAHVHEIKDDENSEAEPQRDARGIVEVESPFAVPETKYARSGETNIAYQVVGSGSLDIVFVMGWVSHLEYFWREPSFARFLRRLASFSRLILFDKRGTGLSDRVPVNELPTLEQRMDDVRAVMDAVGSRRAALCGVSEGGPMCSLFAATYPEKTLALVMIGTYAKRIWAADYPWAPTPEQRAKFYEEMERDWGKAVGLEERAPSRKDDAAFRAWWATYLRMGASPGAALALTKMNAEIDVRHVLGSIRVPTLVIHRRDDACLKIEEGRYVAARIPAARFVELPGADHLPFVGDQDAMLDEIEEFLIQARHRVPAADRVLATVLVVRRTRTHAADGREMIESLWRPHIAPHDEQVRRALEIYRGREVRLAATSPASDGDDAASLVAIFDGPARAIRAAGAISDSAARYGIEARIGLHTGECDFSEDDHIGGIAPVISAHVARQATASETLVSHTVKDLAAGSGIEFIERGLCTFPDTSGEWRLFAVARPTHQ